MCIAILTKPGAQLDSKRFFIEWVDNPHGGGFAYWDGKQVVIDKGYDKYNKMQSAYQKAFDKYGKTSPFLLHMRIRTAGDITPENCHPFKIKDGAMIHNGTMFYPDVDEVDSSGNKKSDSRVFSERLHNVLALQDVINAEEGIIKAIGKNNKLAFLYKGGDWAILNDKAGYWDGDIWYSNSRNKHRQMHGDKPQTGSNPSRDV